MKRAIVWTLIGLIGFASVEAAGFIKLASGLGVGKHANMLLQGLYALTFAVMNVGYLTEMRGRRYFSLHESVPGPTLRIAARPISGWARVELWIAPDHIAYAREIRRTPLVIGLAAMGWLGLTGYSYHLAHRWWLTAALAVIGTVYVLSLLQRCVVLGSTHGTEDVLYGSASQTSQLRAHLTGTLGVQFVREYTSGSWAFESATVLNRVPLTSTEQVQEIQWGMILLGVLGIILAAKASAPALGVIGIAMIIIGVLLSRPRSVARFEGGASMPIPNQVFADTQPGTAT